MICNIAFGSMSDREVMAVRNSLEKNLHSAFTSICEDIASGKINKETDIYLALVNDTNKKYISRDARQCGISRLRNGYHAAIVSDDDAVFNRIKREVLDEMRLWLSIAYDEKELAEKTQEVESFIDTFLFDINFIGDVSAFIEEELKQTPNVYTCYTFCRGRNRAEISNSVANKLLKLLKLALL